MRFVFPSAFAATLIIVPLTAAALPGDTLAQERTRLAAIGGLRPVAAVPQTPNRYETGPSTVQGDSGTWTLTLLTNGAAVSSEFITVQTQDPNYRIVTSGAALVTTLFGSAITADLRSASSVAQQQDDPQIKQTFLRGQRFAYRTVDDERNNLHLVEVIPLGALKSELKDYGATAMPTAASTSAMPTAASTSAMSAGPTKSMTPTSPSTTHAAAGDDAIFVLSVSGSLTPIAVIHSGKLAPVGDSLEALNRLQTQAFATLGAHANRVHIIFGNQTVASAQAAISKGAEPTLKIPATLHLNDNVSALASPTLNGNATHARRAPTPAERSAALALAAAKLSTTPARLTVLNLTAIDLGHGIALIGTVNAKGAGTPRRDKRLFFIAEPRNNTLALTLANIQSITVTEPLLEEVNEYLIDALSLNMTTTAVVTHSIGYDAGTYIIYTRATSGDWKQAYAGGGMAN